MIRAGGPDYTFKPGSKPVEPVTNIVLDDGRRLDPDETCTRSAWTTVDRTPEGRLIWDIVRDYILDNRDKDNVLCQPKINHPELLNVMSTRVSQTIRAGRPESQPFRVRSRYCRPFSFQRLAIHLHNPEE